jgi:hypothetical protein
MRTNHFLIPAVFLMFLFTTAMTYGKATTAPGLHGTIAAVGSSGFQLTVKAKGTSTNSSGETTYDILCDKNTKFMQGGKPVDASVIKEGITVAVVGTTVSTTELHAMTVTILPTPKK